LNSNDQQVKVQAGKQILQAVHIHSRLEESVFYPAVRCIDESLIKHFEQDHQKVDDLLATLDGMSLAEARSDALMRELITALMSHIQEEENDLFPRIEGSGVDMTPVGVQMASFEANMVHTQAQLSDQGAMRR
jgi:hemerythrin superfamily protein